MSSPVPPAIAGALEKAAAGFGVTIYHAELSGRMLRIQVDQPGGVSLATCSRFSRALSAELDRIDATHVGQPLEISSPGVERHLYMPRDYAAAVDRRVRVSTKGGQLEGILVSADSNLIVLNCATGGKDRMSAVEYGAIREARLVVPDADLFQAAGRTETATGRAGGTGEPATGPKGIDE